MSSTPTTWNRSQSGLLKTSNVALVAGLICAGFTPIGCVLNRDGRRALWIFPADANAWADAWYAQRDQLQVDEAHLVREAQRSGKS